MLEVSLLEANFIATSTAFGVLANILELRTRFWHHAPSLKGLGCQSKLDHSFFLSLSYLVSLLVCN